MKNRDRDQKIQIVGEINKKEVNVRIKRNITYKSNIQLQLKGFKLKKEYNTFHFKWYIKKINLLYKI